MPQRAVLLRSGPRVSCLASLASSSKAGSVPMTRIESAEGRMGRVRKKAGAGSTAP
jgi:hypothetical protein